jgi:hypothetical protein
MIVRSFDITKCPTNFSLSCAREGLKDGLIKFLLTEQ